jgi:hypothetical protein
VFDDDARGLPADARNLSSEELEIVRVELRSALTRARHHLEWTEIVLLLLATRRDHTQSASVDSGAGESTSDAADEPAPRER